MADPGVRLEDVKVSDLPRVARSALEDRARYAIVPITVPRALAQSRNPAASADDVGLIVAYLGDRCIGYLGLVPVWLEESGRRRKVLSLSTYFVGEEDRGTGAGTLLLLRALALGHDLFVVGISDVAARVCQALGFRQAGPVVVLTLRIDAAFVLPLLLGRLRHRAAHRTGGFLLRAVDRARALSRRTFEAALRPLVIGLLARPLRAAPGDSVCLPVDSVRPPAGSPSDDPSPGAARFVRDVAIVNWMIHNPWITEDPIAQPGYAFTSRRDLFRFLPFELSEDGSTKSRGYAVLRISADADGRVLRVLDCALAEERYRRSVLHAALREARRWSADRIELGEEFGPLLHSMPVHRRLTRRETRTCLVFTRKPGASRTDPHGDLRVGVCDGDAPFV